VELQVAILWMVQNGHLDAVPVERIKEYQGRLTEFLTTSKSELLEAIRRQGALDETLTGELKATAGQFAQHWT